MARLFYAVVRHIRFNRGELLSVYNLFASETEAAQTIDKVTTNVDADRAQEQAPGVNVVKGEGGRYYPTRQGLAVPRVTVSTTSPIWSSSAASRWRQRANNDGKNLRFRRKDLDDYIAKCAKKTAAEIKKSTVTVNV